MPPPLDCLASSARLLTPLTPAAPLQDGIFKLKNILEGDKSEVGGAVAGGRQRRQLRRHPAAVQRAGRLNASLPPILPCRPSLRSTT